MMVACGEDSHQMPTEPEGGEETGWLRPASHLCWRYTLEVDPDTVGMPSAAEDDPIVEIDIEVFEWGLSPECVGNPVEEQDGVQVWLSPREPFEEDQLAGLPLVDSLPPELFNFHFADPESEPSPPHAPWFLSVVLPDSFKVRIPYQTTGVEGEEPLFFKILDVVGDVTGPDTTFTIVTLPCPNRPWFGHIAFRDQLRDLWERSNPVTPGQDPSGTTERGGSEPTSSTAQPRSDPPRTSFPSAPPPVGNKRMGLTES